MTYTRYAIYYAPEPGQLADFGASWLGWDLTTGRPCPHPDIPDLPLPVAKITATPRKYGFHGTIKPPFRLADGTTPEALSQAARALCATRRPVTLAGLRLSRIGHFLALVPEGDTTQLADLAAAMVTGLDAFRAPPSDAELARRRAARLTDQQDQLLTAWGYPYVMEEFRFHLTLSGRLPADRIDAIAQSLTDLTRPVLPVPLVIRDLCLCGERPDGLFELIERLPVNSSNPDRCAQV